MTLGTDMSRRDKKKLTDQAAERNYGGGYLYAPIQFKADEDSSAEDAFMRPVKFHGFANTGHPDLGRDVVAPEAFTRQTINEFLKFGRQLMFFHGFREQVGEITGAEVVATGKRVMGNRAGGLKVEGFVDSPFDEHGMIPNHPLAHVIHFARMQVQKNRLKAMSIGWMPIKTEMKRMKDPRTGVEANFRFVKALILREVSLVTFAMNPQSTLELQKAMKCAYGDDITAALFCDDPNGCDIIPENVDDFTIDNFKRLMIDSAIKAAHHAKGDDPDDQNQSEPGGQSQMKLVSLDGRPEKKFKVVSLYGG